ncbi:transmembrane amino acid transporter protein-domain-containing protein [Dactylonectria macrodidyma]|uniref:Transmembrane amino acid transporter protein-domain-containing protein n=1 Tax=Dactylonectria macrodidyma TaxID=307937 RepID=A0A9P9D4M8_9HYPO|nr:transmembrane amino acid transporter protein-domain-containing protein [Dactylonectria macrodidyma]
MAVCTQEVKNNVRESGLTDSRRQTGSAEKLGDGAAQGSSTMSVSSLPDNGFGGADGQNFRTMGRWDTVSLLMTNQVGLGVLSLPSVLKVLGIVPGVLAIIGIGCLSWYTAFELVQFYGHHQHVLNIADMARVVGGRKFAIVAGIGFLIQTIMTATSVVVALSVAGDVLSSHSVSTIVFMAIGCLCCWLLCVPRTAKFVSWTGIPCCISIITATLLVIIGLILENPTDAPDPWKKNLVIFAKPTFRDGLNACLKICYAYSSNINFVSYMPEMIDPMRDSNFALVWLEIASISFYTMAAVAVYCLAGEYTVSPALGSASSRIAQIAYGIVLPSILSKGLSFGHAGIKYLYVQIMTYFKITHEMTAPTTRSWSIWMTIVTGFWVVCFVLSMAIPDFDSILSITSATTIAWFTFGFSAILWFHLNWSIKTSSGQNTFLASVNACLIIISLFMNGGGLWSSISELIDATTERSK